MPQFGQRQGSRLLTGFKSEGLVDLHVPTRLTMKTSSFLTEDANSANEVDDKLWQDVAPH
jgi:hypothetical protein